MVGLGLALATCFKPHWAPKTTPLYAVAKGLALGGSSAFLEMMYPGLVVQTLCLTFGTLFTLLAGYRTRLLQVTEGFRSTVYMASGGFFVGMMGMMLMRMCGVNVPFMSGGERARVNGPSSLLLLFISVVGHNTEPRDGPNEPQAHPLGGFPSALNRGSPIEPSGETLSRVHSA